MASLTEQKIKEMEEEMNRFEQEILTTNPEAAAAVAAAAHRETRNRMIIGSQTYNEVQQQISHKPSDYNAAPVSMSVLTPPPPPPLSLTEARKSLSHTSHSQINAPPLLPPPPPPPVLRPSFVPPQLRHRAPLPPPPALRPAMNSMPQRPGMHPFTPSVPGGPVLQNGPYPMHPVPGPHGFPSGPVQMYGVSTTTHIPEKVTESHVVEKPKVIYSAPPVRNIPKGEAKQADSTKSEETVESSQPSETDNSQQAAADSGITEMEVTAVGDMEIEEQEAGTAKKEKKEQKKKFVRTAAGQKWEDHTLLDWDQDDFRIFCGDLGNEVTEDALSRAFSKYPSFIKAKVVRDKRTNKTKGYGFVSFSDPVDFARAMREMNGKYVGNRPIKLRKSCWKERNIEMVRKKEREKKRLGFR